MSKEVYIQVGVTALRSPTGEPLPAVPLYIKGDNLKSSGLTQAEENLLHDVSGLFAEKHEQLTAEKKNKSRRKKCQTIKK